MARVIVAGLVAVLFCLIGGVGGLVEPAFDNLDAPPHDYWRRPLRDPFTALKPALEQGTLGIGTANEKEFLSGLLASLRIPASSQLLVFSTTSLQLGLISPANPRALYFNESVSVGYIPGGKIEVISFDPEVGGIFYIFDIPRGNATPRVERSTRCMNCHSGAETHYVPGLVVKSVIPGPRGGSLEAYRIEQTGHHIPYDQRFGGWYVTGDHHIERHRGNRTGRHVEGRLEEILIRPGERFDLGHYPAATSDIVAHLVHEHQAGFVNRVLEAGYRARTYLHASQGRLSEPQALELDRQAELLVRYLLFADEPSLPTGGVIGDTAFKQDFLRERRLSRAGASLKDFDLTTRLFKFRCSYMVYSPLFDALPAEMKRRVWDRLHQVVTSAKQVAGFGHLDDAERKAIRTILQDTVQGLPAGW